MEIDDEEIELDDPSQFELVSTKSQVDILCDNIRNNANLSNLRKFHFEELSKEDKMKIEVAIYCMLWTFKKVPIEITENLLRDLVSLQIKGIQDAQSVRGK